MLNIIILYKVLVKGHVSNRHLEGPKNVNLILLFWDSVLIPAYFSQVYFAFYHNSIFDIWGTSQALKTIFYRRSIRSLYSLIEQSVLSTNDTFFSKVFG